MRNILSVVAVLCVANMASPPAWAATVIIESSSKDATIFQNNVNNSSGAGNGLFAGTNGTGSPRRALLAFDIAGNLPLGAIVQSVELNLTLGQVAGSGGPGGGPAMVDIGLHRLSADWGEGVTQLQNPASDSLGGQGQGAAANPGDATWNSRFHTTTLWTTPGGDFSATASATATVGTTLNIEYPWLSTAALVSDVQSWFDNPASNFGWILKNADEITATNFRAFFTRDAATAAFHPELTIDYTVVPEPSAMIVALLSLAIASGFARRVRPT